MKNILNKIKNFFKTVAEKFKSFVKKVADKADDVVQNHGEAIITGATVVGVGAMVGSFLYWQKRLYTTRIDAISNKDPFKSAERLYCYARKPLNSYANDDLGCEIDTFNDSYLAEITPRTTTSLSDIGILTKNVLSNVIPSNSPIESMFLVLGKPGIEVNAI